MELKQKFIRDSGYDLEDNFTDTLHLVHPVLAFKIGKYIEDNVQILPNNELRSHVLGGVVMHKNNPITFALELIKQKGLVISLTNLIFISMDEYLDLINLNCYIKSNEKNRQIIEDSSGSILTFRH